MKRLFMKASLVLFAVVFVFAVKGAPAKAETHAYDGKSPYYNDCASSGSTKKSSNLVNASNQVIGVVELCLLYTSPSPRDSIGSRMPSSA